MSERTLSAIDDEYYLLYKEDLLYYFDSHIQWSGWRRVDKVPTRRS